MLWSTARDRAQTVTGYIQANHFPGEGVVDMFWGDSGEIDDAGGAVFGSCLGSTPGAGPSMVVSSEQVWIWYGCGQWRPYSRGSRVTKVERFRS